jgi:ABC-type uncharacterized transport system substrate-binding protein
MTHEERIGTDDKPIDAFSGEIPPRKHAAAYDNTIPEQSVLHDQKSNALMRDRFFAEVGGLLSYGTDQPDNFRRAAVYADRILRGTNPNELPVQIPFKFELVVNLKTAKTLGLDVLFLLQQRADEVIE